MSYKCVFLLGRVAAEVKDSQPHMLTHLLRGDHVVEYKTIVIGSYCHECVCFIRILNRRARLVCLYSKGNYLIKCMYMIIENISAKLKLLCP